MNPSLLYETQPLLGLVTYGVEEPEFCFVIGSLRATPDSASVTACSVVPAPGVIASSHKGYGATILKSGPLSGDPPAPF